MNRPTNNRRGATSLSRRAFLNRLLSIGVVAWAAAIVIPILRFLTPVQETEKVGEVELNESEKKKILDDGFTVVRVGSERVLVTRDARGTLRCLSAECTHEGCTVTYRRDEEIIWCACHNGRFDKFGRILSGPVPKPLRQFQVMGSLDGKVIVTTTEAKT